MYPGDTYILKPPLGGMLVLLPSQASGNTHGATAWTDGKFMAPMLLDELWLMKSPADGIIFWKEEAEVMGQFHPSSEEADQYIDYRQVKEPSERDYLSFIEEGGANTLDREKYVRQRLWWMGNDRIRESGGELIEAHKKNLRRYIELLDDTDDEGRIDMAEAYRELSEFDQTTELLDWHFPPELREVAEFIAELAKRQDCKVAEIGRLSPIEIDAAQAGE
jgi:hypothetical protein